MTGKPVYQNLNIGGIITAAEQFRFSCGKLRHSICSLRGNIDSLSMGDELKMKIPVDQDKVEVNDMGELLWWCAHLGISPEKLLSVVNCVGNSIEKIREYLAKPGSQAL